MNDRRVNEIQTNLCKQRQTDTFYDANSVELRWLVELLVCCIIGELLCGKILHLVVHEK